MFFWNLTTRVQNERGRTRATACGIIHVYAYPEKASLWRQEGDQGWNGAEGAKGLWEWGPAINRHKGSGRDVENVPKRGFWPWLNNATNLLYFITDLSFMWIVHQPRCSRRKGNRLVGVQAGKRGKFWCSLQHSWTRRKWCLGKKKKQF